MKLPWRSSPSTTPSSLDRSTLDRGWQLLASALFDFGRTSTLVELPVPENPPSEQLPDGVWEELADAIVTEHQRLGQSAYDASAFGLPTPPLRLYSVVGSAPRKGITIEETTDIELPRFTIKSSRAAEHFQIGDTFGIGQNEDDIVVWGPNRLTIEVGPCLPQQQGDVGE